MTGTASLTGPTITGVSPFIGALGVVDTDLTFRQAALLELLCNTDGPATVRGLAEQLRVAKPIITRALDALARRHLARRVPNPEDRRSPDIFETHAGRQFYASLTGAMGIVR